MTHIRVPDIAAHPAAFLTERENLRAVDLIESAERSAPFCLCGQHMVAVAEGDRVWLECAGRLGEKTGLAGIVARLTAIGHTRQPILDLPSAD
jgi:hypothetical protein